MSYISINMERCKGCGLCTIACQKKLLSLSDTPNKLGYTVAVFAANAGCTGCTLCAEMCPDVAITVFKEELA